MCSLFVVFLFFFRVIWFLLHFSQPCTFQLQGVGAYFKLNQRKQPFKRYMNIVNVRYVIHYYQYRILVYFTLPAANFSPLSPPLHLKILPFHCKMAWPNTIYSYFVSLFIATESLQTLKTCHGMNKRYWKRKFWQNKCF